MTHPNLERSLKPFLKSLRQSFDLPETPGIPADPIDEFLWSFLLWESTSAKAELALKRILAGAVNNNELRVSLPGEIVGMLGERYPLAEERAVRLRAALDSIFRREHAVSLVHLTLMGKREAKQWLDAIEAVPPFVSARVVLFALGGHAIPLDQRTLDRLIAEELFEPGVALEEATSQLARHIKAADAPDACRLIQAWADSEPTRHTGGSRTASESPTRPKNAKRASSKKSTSRASSKSPRKKKIGS